MKKIQAVRLQQIQDFLWSITAASLYRSRLMHMLDSGTSIYMDESYGVLNIVTLRLSFIYGYVTAFGYSTRDFLANHAVLDPMSSFLPWGVGINRCLEEDEQVQINSPGLSIMLTRDFSYSAGYRLKIEGEAAGRLIEQAAYLCELGLHSACERLQLEVPQVLQKHL